MSNLFRKEKSGADRDFSQRGGVSKTMGSLAIAIPVEQAEQRQRENAAIGVRPEEPGHGTSRPFD